MFKPHTILGFGIWLIVINLLAIPSSWVRWLYVLTGVVFVLAYLFHLWKETILRLADREARSADTFTENGSKGSSVVVSDGIKTHEAEQPRN